MIPECQIYKTLKQKYRYFLIKRFLLQVEIPCYKLSCWCNKKHLKLVLYFQSLILENFTSSNTERHSISPTETERWLVIPRLLYLTGGISGDISSYCSKSNSDMLSSDRTIPLRSANKFAPCRAINPMPIKRNEHLQVMQLSKYNQWSRTKTKQ